jgi:hypothetical protein
MKCLFALLLVAFFPLFALSEPPVALTLSGYHQFAPLPVALSQSDKLWLKQKNRFGLLFTQAACRR